MSDAEIAEFLAPPRNLQVATINRDGTPHLVTMYYAVIDDRIAFWTYRKSQKVMNLRRDPRITVLLLLEGLGFCARGEGGAFVKEGHLRKSGDLPLNTDGGGLSSSHPGMRGIFLLIEATRQLRGQAGDAQVPDCELALACGCGGWLSAISAVILGRDHPS